MKNNINYKQQGYTLIEILIVLTLLSIIISIGTPSIKVIGRFEEKQEIKNLKRDILYARNNAILEGSIYQFEINHKKNFYSISNKNKTIKKIELAYWDILSGNNFTSVIRFSPSGSPNKAGTFTLKNEKGYTIELRISPVTGKLNVHEIK